MADIKTVEGEFTVPSDGHKLYNKTWKTTGTPKAILIFIHGFSDHCNAYDKFFTNLASQKQIEVRSFDQRGWGRSVHKKSQRGLTGGTDLVLSDITSFVEAQLATRGTATSSKAANGSVNEKQEGNRTTTSTNTTTTITPPGPSVDGAVTTTSSSNLTPVFLMGHSMGGNQVISWLSSANADTRSLKAKSSVRGFLIQAPFIRDTSRNGKPHSSISLLFLRVMARIAPHFQIVHKLDPSLLCRDPAENQAFVDDALSHDTGTMQGLWGLAQRAVAISEGRLVIPGDAGEGGRTRLWLGHGDADGFCEHQASKELMERSVQVEDRTFRTYEGGYHQLHAEPTPGKEMFLEDVSSWILARSGPLDALAKA